LARHYTEAGLIEKAADLWGKAGHRSLTRSALVKAQKAIKEHGGVYVGGGFEKTTNLTGGGSMSESPPNRVVLIKFDSVDAAKKWWDTDGKKVNEIGVKFADFKTTWVIEGVEPK